MKVTIELEKEDYDALHDVILNATGYGYLRKELDVVWNGLPQDLKDEAIHWGLSDSVVRDNIYEHVSEKIKK